MKLTQFDEILKFNKSIECIEYRLTHDEAKFVQSSSQGAGRIHKGGFTGNGLILGAGGYLLSSCLHQYSIIGFQLQLPLSFY